ncbi:hypothetical protein HPB47_022554 [Ixodes persulcatus]|uniref:Uncharacterized protein n=1 Tax=Ixodes persulcatus TaxID=34615 RepID=A0AC60QBS1_IXOPE|nr:hypothetical protein HPB47_022554 [Ixodes persulcatus]
MLQLMSKFADALMDMEPSLWACETVNHTSRVHLLCCCDCAAPARAAAQNHVVFSGYFGCHWCLIRGEHTGGTLLKKFVAQVPVLYGQAAMTFNIHQQLHLANTVRRRGRSEPTRHLRSSLATASFCGM